MTRRTMLATVCYGANDIRYEQMDIPDLAADEVLVRVAYCGICPSDFRVYDGRSSQPLPIILGHEFTGWIDEIGTRVTRFQAGDRVVVNPADPCHTRCAPCVRGLTNKCQSVQAGGGGGGLAQYRVAKDANVFPLKPTTDMMAATFVEPLSCVLHGQGRARIKSGSLVLIVGSGPIGLLHMLSAQSAGARVIVSEPHAKRLEAAVRLGANLAVNPTQQDLAEVIRRESDGWGADAIIVAVGNKAAIEGAMPLLAMQGTVVLFAGMYPKVPIMLDPNLIHYSEINITGSSDYTDQDFYQSLTFIEKGIVDTGKLISDILPFERVADGMAIVRTADKLKVIIQVNRE